MPHDNFYIFIFKLEDIFIEKFPSIATKDNVGISITDLLCTVRFKHPCNQFDKLYLLHLFSRFRIFSTITFMNRSLVK